MREILFRGKTENGLWRIGYLSFEDKITIKRKCYDYKGDYVATSIEEYKIDKNTVGQFTGLTDKNGKKIFEGDILKGCWNTIFEVYYDDCLLQFRAKTVDGFNRDIDYYGYPYQIEVIGNIHDNPELLEQER